MIESSIPENLNKKLFENVLKSKHQNSVEIVDFNIVQASMKGDNYTSDIYRVSVNYEVNGKMESTSLIVKYMIEREEVVQILEKFSSLKKEVEMYTNILPRIQSLIGENCSADCYYVVEKPPAFIFQDLKSIGFDLADRHAGLDLKHTKILLEKLGKFHAATMILIEENQNLCDIFREGAYKFPKEDFMVEMFKSSLNLLIKTVRQWDENDYQKIADKLERLSGKFYDKLIECMQGKTDFLVLNHGDVWTNNFMFKYELDNGSKQPTDVAFVDYQLCVVSGLGIDFNYFFHTSPTQEVRENHENELIHLYHNSLCTTLQKLNFKKIPTLNDVKNEIKKYQFHSLFAATCALPAVLMKKIDNLDYNVEGFLAESEFKNAMYANEDYQKVLKKLLIKFDRDGLLD